VKIFPKIQVLKTF